MFPISPKPLSIRIGSIDRNLFSVTHSLRRIVTSRGGHRWTFALSYPSGLSRDAIAELWAFIVSQAGQAGAFEFTAPFQAARGSMAGAPVVDGADQVGNALNLSGFTPSQSAVLKAGDYLRIAGEYKSYLVVDTADSAADGTATITIHPALQAPTVHAAAISGNGIFRCALVADQHELDINDVLHYGLSVDLIEVLD